MGEKNEEKNLTPHRRGWGWVQKKYQTWRFRLLWKIDKMLLLNNKF